MVVRIGDGSVVDSFNQPVPGAAAHGEAYLRAVASNVRSLGLPVELVVDSLIEAKSWRSRTERTALLVKPAQRALRRYMTAHTATASGTSLSIGWMLLGGEYQHGHDVGDLGIFTVGRITDLQVREVQDLTQIVHEQAVLPALNELVDLVSNPNSSGSRGFFGA